MATSFEVRSGRQRVALLTASSAHEALTEYLRGLGCRHDEVRRIGVDVAAWRGATYKAVPATDGAPSRQR